LKSVIFVYFILGENKKIICLQYAVSDSHESGNGRTEEPITSRKTLVNSSGDLDFAN